MKLVVTGASGFVGSVLTESLLQDGHSLTLLTRRAPDSPSHTSKRWLHWTPGASGDWEGAIDGCDGIINLAGEPIAKRRWSVRRKEKIRLSRIGATSVLVDAIAKAAQKPKFLINASAIGYYGHRGAEMVDEESGSGDDFLASVCRDWEAEALKAEQLGCRVVPLRTGIVLGAGAGALGKMLPPFQCFVGGPLGDGHQWMSWIHVDDEVGLIRFVLENEKAHGPVNATAPNPVTNKDFSKTLARVMKRPCFLSVPAFALRGIFGEAAEMLLGSQRVIPKVATELGYQFRYPTLSGALEDCVH
ncbi:MAG: TIGR01777 family protein [Deltaproteobacteria bacterium]|nr:TIGR01777 family protein [Deltaproteobacteria bacterium]